MLFQECEEKCGREWQSEGTAGWGYSKEVCLIDRKWWRKGIFQSLFWCTWKIAVGVGPSNAPLCFYSFLLLNIAFYNSLLLFVVWVSERTYVNNSSDNKASCITSEGLGSPICLLFHNVNSFDLKTKLGKGLILAMTSLFLVHREQHVSRWAGTAYRCHPAASPVLLWCAGEGWLHVLLSPKHPQPPSPGCQSPLIHMFKHTGRCGSLGSNELHPCLARAGRHPLASY